MSKLSRIFARLLVSTTYGGLLGSLVGWAYSLIVGYDGDHPYEYFIFASAMTGSLAMIGALTRVKTLIKFLCVSVGLSLTLYLSFFLLKTCLVTLNQVVNLDWVLYFSNFLLSNCGKIFAGIWLLSWYLSILLLLALISSCTGNCGLTWVLKKIASWKHKTPENLVDEHIDWISYSLINLISQLSSLNKKNCNPQNKQRSWDIGLIIYIARELEEVFPKDWNDWQHWVSDMMDSRTRMQSKGMNHSLVSLIIFYRLMRFAFHIGIDKVFILATRRATR